MNIVKLHFEVTINDKPELFSPVIDVDGIANYLNDKLYTDPDFFGNFKPDSIIDVGIIEND
jgi:hypothetical protein